MNTARRTRGGAIRGGAQRAGGAAATAGDVARASASHVPTLDVRATAGDPMPAALTAKAPFFARRHAAWALALLALSGAHLVALLACGEALASVRRRWAARSSERKSKRA